MVADGLIESDPLVELPYLPEPQVSPTLPVAEVDDIAALIADCASDSFEDVRDRALIHVLADTGVRRGELVGMRWSDLDLAEATITLRSETTKGSKSRVVAIGSDTIRALRLYLRRLDLLSHDDPMWIGRRGPLASNGVGQMITKRARRAGVNLTTHSLQAGIGDALAAPRWLRGPPHAPRRMDEPADDRPLHRLGGDRGIAPSGAQLPRRRAGHRYRRLEAV